MPFSYTDFKAVCHKRAMTPAILAMDVEPLAATLVTEHNASFPKQDSQECYISVAIGASGRTFEAIRYAKYFSLNLLDETQVDIAHAIYGGDLGQLQWKKLHNVPYLHDTNTIICSFNQDQSLSFGPNKLVIGHVFRVIKASTNNPPLVNFDKHYCRIDGTRIPVVNRNINNERLED